MQVSSVASSNDQSVLQRQLVVDQRSLAEHVAARASQAVLAADQLAVLTDEQAIAAARSGSLDVLT